MIDTNLPREYELSDRMQAVSDGRRAYRLQPVKAVGRRGRLSAAEAAERREEGLLAEDEELEVSETSVAVAPPVAPADPGAALRHARIGFVTAAVLVLMLVWIMQRRKGA